MNMDKTIGKNSRSTLRWEILLFFLVTYAFTWFGHLGNWLLPSEAWPRPMFVLGPLFAAPLLIWSLHGRSDVKAWWLRIIRFRAPAAIYAAATIVPAAIIMASVGLAIALGAKPPTRENLASCPALLLILLALPDGPLPEEVSFRGHGQFQLQQTMSPLAASLWIGLGVLVWHIPVLVWQYIPWPMAIALPAVSVVYAWLYQAGGSVWPLIALHLTQNVVGGMYFGAMFAGHDNVLWTGFLATFYVAWAVGLAWRLGPDLGHPVRTT